jgi:prolipoprotein diacylglyceryl transferase
MRPELFDIPFIYYGVKGYGFMLMVGFLTGIWWATRRAMKVKANPDLILNVGFVALVFGVVGARAFYVAHYYERNFAGRGLGAMLDVTAGGLEFYGGFIGAMVFIIWYVASHGRPVVARTLGLLWIALTAGILWALNDLFHPREPMSVVLPVASVVVGLLIARALWQWSSRAGYGQPASLRLYLDIMTPSLMWGLAFGRIGCFLNGCCWGAPCENPKLPWAVQFPCSSPAQIDEWTRCEVTLPAPLIYINPRTGYATPIPRDLLTMSPGKRLVAERRYEQLDEKLQELQRTRAPEAAIARAQAQLTRARGVRDEVRMAEAPLLDNMRLYNLKPSDIERLAQRSDSKSAYVQPTQLYACVNAFLLAFLLNAIFYRRKRHGVVFGMLWLLYPIARFVEEAIRADNPLDSGFGILTISQAVSLGGLLFAAVYFWWLWRLPLRSPRAVAYVPPELPSQKKKA